MAELGQTNAGMVLEFVSYANGRRYKGVYRGRRGAEALPGAVPGHPLERLAINNKIIHVKSELVNHSVKS